MDGVLTDTSAKAAAESWLGDFQAALASGDAAHLAALFARECHWRDILAFHWNLHTTSGAEAIASAGRIVIDARLVRGRGEGGDMERKGEEDRAI